MFCIKSQEVLLVEGNKISTKATKGFLTYHAKAGALCEPAAEWGRGAFMGDNNTVVRRQENYPGLTKHVRPGGKKFCELNEIWNFLLSELCYFVKKPRANKKWSQFVFKMCYFLDTSGIPNTIYHHE